MLCECHFRITDLMMISFRYCAENAAEIPQKYRGQTAENTAGNLQVSYAKRSVYNTKQTMMMATTSTTSTTPAPSTTAVSSCLWGGNGCCYKMREQQCRQRGEAMKKAQGMSFDVPWAVCNFFSSHFIILLLTKFFIQVLSMLQ